MQFGEKIRIMRQEAKMSQTELAKAIGVSLRTVQYYELGEKYPKQTDIYGKLASLFNVSADYLLSDEDQYIIEANKKGGVKSVRDVKALITEVGGLFAGGELSEEDKDKVIRALNDLYWRAKDNNKKYSSNKSNSDSNSNE